MNVQKDKLFIREEDFPGYQPAGHTGTVNRRIVGPGQGARHLEVVLGTIDPGQGASSHFHPGIDQFCYMLQGTASVTIGNEIREIGPGEGCFFPADTPHTFTATGNESVRVLVVYGPPYHEGARVEV